MKAVSLRRLLTLQWIGFVASLLLAMGAAGVVALYVLEDSFIDRRLVAAERTMTRTGSPPPPVRLLRPADLPASLQAGLADLTPGALREYRLADGRYLHLRTLPHDARGPRLLAIEAQDELRVSQALLDAAPTLLGLLVLILLLAAWMARRFVTRVERALAGLLPAVDGAPDAAALRQHASGQPVQEFQRFGHALADALEARLAAVQREADTLRFLAHELRTPLQSARLALSNLAPDTDASPARARLQRSLQRLERASAAVLWLGEHTPAVAPTAVAPTARSLVEEFAPLAAQRRQKIECVLQDSPSWALPVAAIEAVLGNLLLNALQHGAPGAIRLHLTRCSLVVENALSAGADERMDEQVDADGGGFGLGLELARRLLARIGWTLQAGHSAGRFVVRLQSPQTPA